jgi:hypothetical protein
MACYRGHHLQENGTEDTTQPPLFIETQAFCTGTAPERGAPTIAVGARRAANGVFLERNPVYLRRARRDSNPQPTDSKSGALSIELRARLRPQLYRESPLSPSGVALRGGCGMGRAGPSSYSGLHSSPAAALSICRESSPASGLPARRGVRMPGEPKARRKRPTWRSMSWSIAWYRCRSSAFMC